MKLSKVKTTTFEHTMVIMGPKFTQLTVWATWKEFLTFSRAHTWFYARLGLFKLGLATCNSKQQQWQSWTWVNQLIQTPLNLSFLLLFNAEDDYDLGSGFTASFNGLGN